MNSFTIFDYVIVLAYIVATLIIGLRFSRKQKDLQSYFIADRSGRPWAVAISAVATGLSAISYLGVPAWVYENDLQLNVAVLLLPPSMFLVAYLFVPVFARLRVITIYEYLEGRFNLAVRVIASGLFLLLRGAWLATAIYTQSLLLTELSGAPLYASVILIGFLTAIYTILGGMEAVLWTDVMQFFVLVGGLVAILLFALMGIDGGFGQAMRIAHAADRTRAVDLSFSLTQITLWGILLFTVVDNLCTYGSDQVMVQRFLTSPSPQAMRRAVIFTGLLSLPVVALLALVGLVLFSYYQSHPELRATLSSTQRVVPHFVGNVLPSGAAGLVVAGVFAATMSTLSAGFNSLATATVIDFSHRLRRRGAGDAKKDLMLARLTTLLWAAASTAAAIVIGYSSQKSIVELFGTINSMFAGPILGLFLLGMLFRKPKGMDAISGVIAGAVVTAYVSLQTSISWLYYAPIGLIVTVGVGHLSSFLTRAPVPASPEPLKSETEVGG